MKTTITLTPDDLKVIIREHLSKKFASVGAITMEVRKVAIGSQMREETQHVFRGATCEVDLLGDWGK